ncbi:MAG: hypothetical protein DWH97_02520 [Planctomycetota bacterium]|nr:MAG: hypothetical protein DWH97_02520 [Planctomycetota bacterium]RLS93306.1 MAG: hypothetical protein DWI12_09400 [Planctomycetota bacterium]
MSGRRDLGRAVPTSAQARGSFDRIPSDVSALWASGSTSFSWRKTARETTEPRLSELKPLDLRSGEPA